MSEAKVPWLIALLNDPRPGYAAQAATYERWANAAEGDKEAIAVSAIVEVVAPIAGAAAMRGRRAPDPWQRVPQSLQDQMALSAAQKGAGQMIISNLNDPRYKGMEKWEYKVKSQQGKDSVVHYVRDPATGELMDFKFKKSTSDTPRGTWDKTPDPSVGPGTAPSWWPFN